VLSLLVVRAVYARSKFGAENLLGGRRDSKVGNRKRLRFLGARAFRENASPFRAQDHTQSHSSHDGELEAWVSIIAMFSLMVSLFALGLWLRQECHKLKLRKFRDCDLPGRYDSSTVL
jgi:hypothetical protein